MRTEQGLGEARVSMTDQKESRDGETTVELPQTVDAALFFIGTIRTPWLVRNECPRRGDLDGPICRLLLDERWRDAAVGLEGGAILDVLYWMHLARRDLTRQNPKSRGVVFGTFALRSPVRPNPIAASSVKLVDVSGLELAVRGLDCVDGTPLVDIKPSRCPMWRPDDVGRRA